MDPTVDTTPTATPPMPSTLPNLNGVGEEEEGRESGVMEGGRCEGKGGRGEGRERGERKGEVRWGEGEIMGRGKEGEGK